MKTNKTAVLTGAAALTTAIGVVFLSSSLPDSIFANGFDPVSAQCGQQQTANINFQVNSRGIVSAVAFENILGKTDAGARPVLFPGANVSPYINDMKRDGFIAAKFVMPSLPIGKSGMISMGETFFSSLTSMSLSPSCGFALPPPNPRCLLENLNKGQGIAWKVDGDASHPTACPLTPGQTYFFNLKFTTVPPANSFNCGQVTCKLPLINNAG